MLHDQVIMTFMLILEKFQAYPTKMRMTVSTGHMIASKVLLNSTLAILTSLYAHLLQIFICQIA